MAIGMCIGALVFEVSITAKLFPWEGVLLVCGAVSMLTRVSGSGVVDIVGCNVALCIPLLFLEGLPDPAVWFMSVTSLLISLCNAIFLLMKNHGNMLSNAMIVILWITVKKTDQYLKFLHF